MQITAATRLDGMDLADGAVLRRHRAAAGGDDGAGSGARPAAPRAAACSASMTTRGDRLFISLLSAGFIHLLWLAMFGTPLWGASALALVLAAAGVSLRLSNAIRRMR